MLSVTRLEDMSAVGRLHVMYDNDGDIIVSVQEQTYDELIGPSRCVEFCTIGIGGGGSPRTYKALQDLMVAMQQDNEDHNYQGRACYEKSSL